MQSRLSGFPKNTSPEYNNGILPNCPGVNTTQLNVDSKYAISNLRVEDQAVDSAYLMVGAAECAERLFLIVHGMDTNKCADAMRIQISHLRNSVKGGKGKWGEVNCTMPYQHGVFIFSTRWYDKMGIAYTIVRLTLGDLLFVRSGLLCQQLSIGFNVVETVDVGSPFWTSFGESFQQCPCAIGQAMYLPMGTNLYAHVTDHQVGVFECTKSGCDYTTNDSALINIHINEHTREPSNSAVCAYCKKVFNKNTLRYHTYKCRRGKDSFNKVCDICGKTIHSSNLSRHRKTHEKKEQQKRT